MLKVIPLRLKPGQDLRQSLKDFAQYHQLQAGFVLTAIGSLTQASLRFANQPHSETLQSKYEIISLNGTISVNGVHLHMAIADETGCMVGGHLTDGSIIYTTAEIVIGECEGWTFTREPDEQTGFLELKIEPQ